MAIYHLSGQLITRSQGRSSVAASAYRSAERLVDERTGQTHDFTNKAQDVLDKAILLPEGAPSWLGTRERLWNHVEQVEKRVDAQLAREFNITLPRELTPAQNIALAREFVQTEFVARGMVADLCVHRGHQHGQDQPHFHVMLSLREVDETGFGKKVRSWNDRALLCHWRESWAAVCNRQLALHGHDQHIDHRTLEAQGIELEPQRKIGPKAAQARLARLHEHQAIARANGERLLAQPIIALEAITRQQSTFTHHDLARFVNRHSAGRTQFQQVYAAVRASPELVRLGCDAKGRERMTTRAMLNLERKLILQAETKASQHHHTVSERQARRVGHTLTPGQRDVFEYVLRGGDVVCVVGYAGTGKSYLLGAAQQAWTRQGYRVCGMALSAQAADNLTASSGISSHTIANRLTNWQHDRSRLTARDIVVVDEAGMVGSRQLAAIMDEATRAGAKLVLVGDSEQLQAIEAGAAFRAVAERTGWATLSEVHRQQHAWQRTATEQFGQGQTHAALSAYAEHGQLHRFDTQADAMNAMLAAWQTTRNQAPDKSQLLLAYTRADVHELNVRARELRREGGELGADQLITTHRGTRAIATGERLMCLRNDKSLDVKNGQLGIVEAIRGPVLVVRFDGEDKSRTIDTRDYPYVEHGYATTVHKSQGATVTKAYVLASPHFDRHVTYVAMSRHRESVELYWSGEQFADKAALMRALERERSKDVSLDYAERRGFDTQPRHERETDGPARTPEEVRGHTPEEVKGHTPEEVKERTTADISPALAAEAQALAEKMGQPVNVRPQPGEIGLFRGSIKLAGEVYTLVEQECGMALLSYRADHGFNFGERGRVVDGFDTSGREQLQLVRITGREYGELSSQPARNPDEVKERTTAEISPALAAEAQALAEKMGQPVNVRPQPGEIGLFRGSIKLAGEVYTLVEQEHGMALVPYQADHGFNFGERGRVVDGFDTWGRQQLQLARITGRERGELSSQPARNPDEVKERTTAEISPALAAEVQALAEKMGQPVNVRPQPGEIGLFRGSIELAGEVYTLVEQERGMALVPYQADHGFNFGERGRVVDGFDTWGREQLQLARITGRERGELSSQPARNPDEVKERTTAEISPALAAEVQALAEKMGQPVNVRPQPGEIGLFRGSIELAGEVYTLVEQERGMALVPYQADHGFNFGERGRVVDGFDTWGREQLQLARITGHEYRELSSQPARNPDEVKERTTAEISPALAAEAQALAEKMGQPVNVRPQPGEIGLFRGSIELAGEVYTLVEQERGMALVPYQADHGFNFGERGRVVDGFDTWGREQLQLARITGRERGELSSQPARNPDEVKERTTAEISPALAAEVQALAEKMGQPVNVRPQPGEIGLFRGSIELAGEVYTLVEQERGMALVPYQADHGFNFGERGRVVDGFDTWGREQLQLARITGRERGELSSQPARNPDEVKERTTAEISPALAAEAQALAEKMGQPVNVRPQPGETGLFRGSIELAGEVYTLVEQERGMALVPYQADHGFNSGERGRVVEGRDTSGRQQLQLARITGRERGELGREIDF